jgi:hypothetical protein
MSALSDGRLLAPKLSVFGINSLHHIDEHLLRGQGPTDEAASYVKDRCR